MKLLTSVFIALVFVTACSSGPAPLPTEAAPNPASANCVEKGGKLDIRSEANGQVGYCQFPDGSECEEWAYFRNECQPKTPIASPTAVPNMPNPASANCIKQGGELVIRTDANGEAGYCQFPDGSECEEWALFRAECAPGATISDTTSLSNTVLAPIVSNATSATPEPVAPGLANPASTNCLAVGGTLEIRKNELGGEVGYCAFPDGSECEEWALLRGECQPGRVVMTPTPSIVLAQPRRIVFPEGSTLAQEHGTAGPGQTFPYVLRALAGQIMTVKLTPQPGGQAVLIIRGADGTVLLSDLAGAADWSGVLPATQDYYIDVRSAPSVWTDFWLDVTIPPLATESPLMPIEFKPGTAQATVQGAVAPNGVMRYSVCALMGQVMIVNLTATQGSAMVRVLSAEGAVVEAMSAGATLWSGKLPDTQDYIIEVRSQTNIVTDYALEIMIQPL